MKPLVLTNQNNAVELSLTKEGSNNSKLTINLIEKGPIKIIVKNQQGETIVLEFDETNSIKQVN